MEATTKDSQTHRTPTLTGRLLGGPNEGNEPEHSLKLTQDLADAKEG